MTITKQELDIIIDKINELDKLCKNKVYVGLNHQITVYPINDGIKTFYSLAEELGAVVEEVQLGDEYLSDYECRFDYKDFCISLFIEDFRLLKWKEEQQNAGISNQVQTEDV